MPPVINQAKCIACDKCVEVCHQDVFYGSKEKEIPIVRYPDECWHCGACDLDCPVGAIEYEIPLPMRIFFVTSTLLNRK